METITELEQKVLVRKAVAEYIEFMNAANIKHTETHFPMLQPEAYELDGGRKFLRISCVRGATARSVHSFVDALTGDVYKAAGYKAPALNGARFNLLDEASFEDLKTKWDPYGSYLYKR